jgi:hypothetical protein
MRPSEKLNIIEGPCGEYLRPNIPKLCTIFSGDPIKNWAKFRPRGANGRREN